MDFTQFIGPYLLVDLEKCAVHAAAAGDLIIFYSHSASRTLFACQRCAPGYIKSAPPFKSLR